jgi:hypothetical protein
MYFIKLQRSLYGLKQSGHMWYDRLSDYLTSKGYKNNTICTFVFIKKTTSGYVIIAVYVDDLDIIGTNIKILEVIELLKMEFEIKDLGKPNIVLVCRMSICLTEYLYINKLYKKSLEMFQYGQCQSFKHPNGC